MVYKKPNHRERQNIKPQTSKINRSEDLLHDQLEARGPVIDSNILLECRNYLQ